MPSATDLANFVRCSHRVFPRRPRNGRGETPCQHDNEDDVRASFVVRDWLVWTSATSDPGDDLPAAA